MFSKISGIRTNLSKDRLLAYKACETYKSKLNSVL